MIKAIFLDVDGTLVSFTTHDVPQSAIDAICLAHDSGIKILIATGRAANDLHEIENIPYDAVVALNGADCVLRNGIHISRKQISLEDFHKAQELASYYGFVLGVETDRGIMVNEVTDDVIALAKLVNHPIPRKVNLEEEFVIGDCCQLCFYCDLETERKVMLQLPNLAASRWNPIFADINVAGVNKATGIEEFAKYYGFDISETMAFGDGGNDIPMLRAVGTGIAMGGASDIVKSEAQYVTTEVDENGILNALVHFGIIS